MTDMVGDSVSPVFLDDRRLAEAAAYAAGFGDLLYEAYDLHNQTEFGRWPLALSSGRLLPL